MVRRREASVLQQAVAIVIGVLMALLITSLAHWGGSAGATGPRTVSLGPYLLNNTTTGYSLSFPNCSSVKVYWQIVFGVTANFSGTYRATESFDHCNDYVPPSNATCSPYTCNPYSTAAPICFEQGRGGNCTFTSDVPGYGFGLAGQGYLEAHGLLTVSFTVVYVTDG